MKQKLLARHFSIVRDELLQSYRRVQIANHRGIRGQGREALAEHFLKTHLPKVIDFFTGEIIDHTDSYSTQMDLILYAGHCPRLPLFDDHHLAFVDGVMAGIEVKSILDSNQLDLCMTASARLKTLIRGDAIVGRNDTHDWLDRIKLAHRNVRSMDRLGIDLRIKPERRRTNLAKTPYIVFAYQGMPLASIRKYLEAYRTHPAEDGPDLILNLSEGYYVYKNNDWLWPQNGPVQETPYLYWSADAEERRGEVLGGLYMLLTNLSASFTLFPPLINVNQYFAPPRLLADQIRPFAITENPLQSAPPTVIGP